MNFLKYLCQTEILQLEFETRNKNNRDSAKSIRANVLCVFFFLQFYLHFIMQIYFYSSRGATKRLWKNNVIAKTSCRGIRNKNK